MAPHTRLANPLVVEVVLEVRFRASRPLDTYIEQFTRKIRSSYPSRKKLNIVGLEVNLDSNAPGQQPTMRMFDDSATNSNTPRYRYDGYRGSALQIGEGILSIHHTAYEGFGDFVATSEKVIALHKNYSALQEYTGFRLRYLNLIPMGEDGIRPSDYLAWALRDPPGVDGSEDIKSVQNTQQTVSQYVDHGVQRLHFAVPFQLGHRYGLLIDIDHTAESEHFPHITGEDAMVGWINQAHEHIWSAFVSSLKPEYLEELSNDFISN